ncbi:MAG: LytR/AlgR family response regulator transcription factor [Lautropia sp.]
MTAANASGSPPAPGSPAAAAAPTAAAASTPSAAPTALIAEDEPLLATALAAELAALWPELRIVAVAPNGIVAQRQLLEQAPDVAFLDIRMPGANGIEVAHALAEDWPSDRPPPLLVFVTAFEQFALDAFAHAAVDYVLKPVERERLAQTVQRLRQRLAERHAAADPAPTGLAALSEQLRRLLASPAVQPAAIGQASGNRADPGTAATEPLRLIRAGVGDTVRMIRIDDVVYLQATDKYVNVVTAEGEALIRESLRDLLPRLDPVRFAQIHRSTVVNLDRVRSATRDDTGKVWLTLEGRSERLSVSRIYVHLFKPM